MAVLGFPRAAVARGRPFERAARSDGGRLSAVGIRGRRNARARRKRRDGPAFPEWRCRFAGRFAGAALVRCAPARAPRRRRARSTARNNYTWIGSSGEPRPSTAPKIARTGRGNAMSAIDTGTRPQRNPGSHVPQDVRMTPSGRPASPLIGDFVVAIGPAAARCVAGLTGFDVESGGDIAVAVRGSIRRGTSADGTHWLALADLVDGRLDLGAARAQGRSDSAGTVAWTLRADRLARVGTLHRRRHRPFIDAADLHARKRRQHVLRSRATFAC